MREQLVYLITCVHTNQKVETLFVEKWKKKSVQCEHCDSRNKRKYARVLLDIFYITIFFVSFISFSSVYNGI